VHLISDLTMLHHPRMHSIPKPLHLATSDAVGGIIASGSLCLADARGRKLWLHNVQCAPAANMNLISVSAAIRDGCRFGTDPAGAHIKMTGPHAWSSPVLLKRGLYFLDLSMSSPVYPGGAVTMATQSSDPQTLPHDCRLRMLWHSRLGHPGASSMVRMTRESLVTGLPVSLIPCADCPSSCEACIQGKQTRPPFGRSSRPAQDNLDRIHIDTVGELSTVSLTGDMYWVTVIYEASHFVTALPVKTKSEIPGRLKELLIY